MKRKVTVFGSFVVDLMARTPLLPIPGATVKGSSFKMGPGGKGFNQGVAAHKAGADMTMITKMGRDVFAVTALDLMTQLNMNKDCLFFSESEATGIALIGVDENTSQNEIIVVPGACATFTKEEVAQVEPVIADSSYVLLQLEVNQDANEYVAQLAKEHGAKVILNPAPYQKVSDEFLSKIFLVTPNENEAEEMTGVPVTDLASASRAAKVFYEKGVENVLITLGSRGVFVSSEGREEIIPAFRVDAVDTTGAGDAFNGGLLTALAEGKSLWDAAVFGNALAALSVQKMGTSPAMPTRQEIDDFLRQQI